MVFENRLKSRAFQVLSSVLCETRLRNCGMQPIYQIRDLFWPVEKTWETLPTFV